MNSNPMQATNPAGDFDVLAEQAMSRHPLELFPIFRRWECGFWRNILYTAIWNTLLALAFSVITLGFESNTSPLKIVLINLLFAQCIGYTIHLLFGMTDRLVPVAQRRSIVARTVYYALMPAAGVYIGYWIGAAILGWHDMQAMLLTLRGASSIVLVAAFISGLLLAILIPRERAARAQMRIAHEEARVAAAEKETAIARLQLLSAQIEPHFLYNTLAHVVSLVDSEPATAKRMLDRLIALLRSTAAGSGASTLGTQLDHLRAYLDILALRMGARLTWRIDVPTDLAAVPLPPMLLQPLVENAIKHGLEPSVEGGDVTISAQADENRLLLTVADTGLGFRATCDGDSTGLGLANLRARLGAVYGSQAALSIMDNAPRGAKLTLALPLAADLVPTS